MLQFLLAYLILLFKTKIVCIDIKVSIGKKIGNDADNIYPIYLNLNEPIINKTNPIDLFCIFDITSKMNIINLKRTLYLIVDALDSEDRLSLILFYYNYVQRKFSLEVMDKDNKEKSKTIINSISNTDKKESTFNNAIKFIFTELNDKYNETRIQSVIFISAANNADKNPVSFLKNLMNDNNKREYDFTFHTLSFNEDSKGGDLLDLSNYRDGSYYSINNFLQAKNSVLNIIGGLKTTNYKLVKINVTSSDTKFRIRYIFGYDHISNTPSISSESKFNIKIQQFITGKDYTYIFLMKLPDNMKNGEKILKISVEYKDFIKNKKLKNYKFLYYYNSVKYFEPKKDEFCRVKAFEAIYSYSINKININQYNKRISRISDDCQTNLNKNISDLMYDVYNSMEKKNWINGSVSEGYLKRGGIHLWYSNSYQLELINNYTDIKY